MSHLTSEERDMIGNSVAAKTHWVWTETTERIYPDRKAGMPVPDHHKNQAPQIWVHRGYVREGEVRT